MPVTRGAVWLAKVIDECRFGTSLFRLYRRDCGAERESSELRSAYGGGLTRPGPPTVNERVKQWPMVMSQATKRWTPRMGPEPH